MPVLYDTPYLTYDPEKMDPSKPCGLWFCVDMLERSAVQDNAVCLGGECTYADLSRCREFILQFPYVFVAVADPAQREQIALELERRVPGIAVYTPGEGAFRGCRSIRELLEAGGIETVQRLLCGAVERKAHGLLDLAEVERPDMSAIPRTLSGIRELDRSIGGFYAGELSVWTGRRGGGKSTLLGQLLLEALNQGVPVCAYSGELPAWRFKQWVLLQAAGPAHVETRQDPVSGKDEYLVAPFLARQVDDWWRERFFLYDNRIASSNDADSILCIFDYAARRYGCKVFLVDNLMTAKLDPTKEADYYRAQSNFTGQLVQFAKKNDVHVHLVAHPRKSGKTGSGRLEADDVGGSGDVTNRADNAFALERLSEADGKKQGCAAVLSVLKNRAYGSAAMVKLDFDPPSRRYFKSGAGDPHKKLGWEHGGQVVFTELDKEEDTPWTEKK